MLYRGREGMWSYYLHRITGVGIFVFLLAHIVDTAMIRVSANAYNRMIALYRLPFFKWGEIALVGAVLFHALNGIRVVLIDFWTEGPRYHKQMFYVVLTLLAFTFVPTAIIMLSR